MPQLTTDYDPKVGPTIPLIVSDPLSYRREEDSARQERLSFLVDTGASDSSISGRVADRLALPVLGLHAVTGFASVGNAYQYLADVELSFDQVFPIPDMRLLRFEYDTEIVHGILGRVVPRLGTLVLDGPNRRFTLTF